MQLALLLAGSYLLGAIPVGLLIVRMAHRIDIRKFGSGNVGTANVFRTTGAATAILVLLFDVAKGAAPVLIAKAWGFDPYIIVLAGLLSVIGHSYSVFLKFTGGKSVATTGGVVLALDPVTLAAAVAFYLVILLASRYASLASLSGTIFAVLFMVWRPLPTAYVVFALIAAVVIFYRHRSNIKRLLEGKELRISGRSRSGDN